MTPNQNSTDAGAWLPPTEQRNPRSTEIDALGTLETLRLLNDESAVAVEAVDAVLPELAGVVEEAVARMRRGGTIHYFGAGTSGRLGVLDASELKPTFNLAPDRVVAHIAGGSPALMEAVENAEDSADDGRREAETLGENDMAVGIAASGSTPYVGGALEAAQKTGAFTVLISNNPDAPLAEWADSHLVLDTGAEIITGSTRLKAGTAQKLALNAFSTAVMIAQGRTWENLMVSVVATNAKLRERTVRILCEAVGLEEVEAEQKLQQADGDLKVAIVMSLAEISVSRAAQLLQEHSGSVRAAVAASSSSEKPHR
ncbi:N-acetylmuramic acid 6-phosphate etherase [Nesterenkonia haasae]|uniref:N-acetylmuramic acid 6-phosphate etherase n=1 Tax=Nesterenkonia haasae TaxID=2587813 RepID=UPI001391546A|nr:N-acetylmuramic acid 6-phosphate etherase [Nesterenkonia haasae]NDK31571.1 N-acetylmuramic acid 6-phosphate etherase [Nesterenkonia haasae]